MSRTDQDRKRPDIRGEHYTPAEVAALFRVDSKTVTRWAQKGWLTSIRTLGGHRRYSTEQVDRLLRDGLPAQDLEDQNLEDQHVEGEDMEGEDQHSAPAAVPPAAQDSAAPAPVPGPVPDDADASGADVSGAGRHPVDALIEDRFGGDATAALLELAGRYGLAVAYLDRPWFTRYLGRSLTEAEWNRIAAELNDFCAVLDDVCAEDLAAYTDLVLHTAHIVPLESP